MALYHIAIYNNVEIVWILLNIGANIDLQDCKDYIPLSYIVAKGSTNVLTLLINYSALIDVMIQFPRVPLLLAAKKGYIEIINILLERGILVEYRGLDLDDMPLTQVVWFRYKKIFERLLDIGVSIYNTTNYGQTSLYLVVSQGNPEIVRILLEWGIEANALDCDRYIALIMVY